MYVKVHTGSFSWWENEKIHVKKCIKSQRQKAVGSFLHEFGKLFHFKIFFLQVNVCLMWLFSIGLYISAIHALFALLGL